MTGVAGPTGFCPRCGYPISPGRCSECGSLVSADRILADHGQYARRHIFRRARPAILVALIAICFFTLKNRVDWITWVPSGLLLHCQGLQRDAATLELLRRLEAGDLTAAQAARLRDQGLEVTINLPRRLPYPQRVLVRLSVSAVPQLPADVLGLPPGPRRMDLLGTLVVKRIDDGRIVWQTALTEPGRDVFTPGLPAGTYSVEVEADAVLSHRYDVQRQFTWAVSERAMLVVDAVPVQPPAEALEWKAPGAADGAVAVSAYHCWYDCVDGRVVLDIRVGNVRLPVAGSVWVRDDSAGDYVRLDEPFVPLLTGRRYLVELPSWAVAPDAETLDVRIEPDAELAYAMGLRRHVRQVIERLGVPIEFPTAPFVADSLIDFQPRATIAGPHDSLPNPAPLPVAGSE